MTLVLTVLHVVVCIFLVTVVLLQRGKGAEIGAVFGSGASSTVFGGRGAGNFLTKLTTGSAIVFMITSLSLSYLATENREERLQFDSPEAAAAMEGTAAEEGSVFDEVEGAAEERGGFEEVGEVPAAALVDEAEEAVEADPGAEAPNTP